MSTTSESTTTTSASLSTTLNIPMAPTGSKPGSRPSLSSLPPEIITTIFEWLPKRFPRRGGLFNTCLLSKHFNKIATPILYRYFDITFTKEAGIQDKHMEALFSIPKETLKHVRILRLECVKRSAETGDSDPWLDHVRTYQTESGTAVQSAAIEAVWRNVAQTFIAWVQSNGRGLVLDGIRINLSYDLLDIEMHFPLTSSLFRIQGRSIPISFAVTAIKIFIQPSYYFAGEPVPDIMSHLSALTDSGTRIHQLRVKIKHEKDILLNLFRFTKHFAHCVKEINLSHSLDFLDGNHLGIGVNTDLDYAKAMVMNALKTTYKLDVFGLDLEEDSFKCLESLCLANSGRMDLFFPTLKAHIDPEKLTSLYFHNLNALGVVPDIFLQSCTKLNELKIRECDLLNISQILAATPAGLKALHMEYYVDDASEDSNTVYPEAEYMLKHKATLKRLWLRPSKLHRRSETSRLILKQEPITTGEMTLHTLNEFTELEMLCYRGNGLELKLPKLREVFLFTYNDRDYADDRKESSRVVSKYIKTHFALAGSDWRLKVVTVHDHKGLWPYLISVCEGPFGARKPVAMAYSARDVLGFRPESTMLDHGYWQETEGCLYS